jgi:hypothetical protein
MFTFIQYTDETERKVISFAPSIEMLLYEEVMTKMTELLVANGYVECTMLYLHGDVDIYISTGR